ncbi:hypothetical protein HK407_04g08040 [Ordospora pajunii]|uniref:uncharacterized protein n=1 Tax=Ordospora pajunii TaxID=3039483 RepID=UPI0029526ECC|nr:uncharacterized protein HK407_04g08040 [Ordospora pajunii]KAH9411694.1 hypothetical protein HK407_04g08040 [Ordospora pajunii]
MQQIRNDCAEGDGMEPGCRMNELEENRVNDKDTQQSIESIMKMSDAFWFEDEHDQEHINRFVL